MYISQKFHQPFRFTLVALPALFLGAAASRIEARGTCIATFSGSNSEGGGGPGQAPINNNAWGIIITGGGKQYHAALKQTGKNGVMDKEIERQGVWRQEEHQHPRPVELRRAQVVPLLGQERWQAARRQGREEPHLDRHRVGHVGQVHRSPGLAERGSLMVKM
ncbi:hypothetical protein PWT90_10588 [Aphanocladium album]|nr:hypothetical protein PWT90_10588 [Aphanocladium album]